MKPWILPSVLVVALAATITASSVVAPPELPLDATQESDPRISVVCPAPDTATAAVRIAAVAVGQSVRTSKVSTPVKVTESKKLVVVANPRESVRVWRSDSNCSGRPVFRAPPMVPPEVWRPQVAHHHRPSTGSPASTSARPTRSDLGEPGLLRSRR